MILNQYILLFKKVIFWGRVKTSNFTRRKFKQVLQLWPNHSSLLKKLSLDYPGQILVVFHCLLDFNYMAFKGLLCGIFVHLESHHIASKSFEIFPTSPNNLLLMNKLCLAHWWYTWEKLLEFTSAFNILPFSFMCLNFWKFEISYKIPWNFPQITISIFVVQKT